ncbi:MAG: hypothetical protein SOY32_05755 [Candidatus Faecousia sp.]|nr:hypothetical protein [Candidatus Faecousia sp.]
MTELETMQRAKMYLDKLARGIDPITNQVLPGDSVLNQPRLSRCFTYVSDLLARVILNDGYVGAKPKGPKLPEFNATAEELAGVPVSSEPVRISKFLDGIFVALNRPQMRKLGTTTVTDWLLRKGLLEKRTSADGTSQRLPTQEGAQLGIFTETRHGQYGDYTAVFYDMQAQKFILEHLPEILEEKRANTDNCDS